MSNVDLAYVAGFFDGEGCISIKKYSCKERKAIRYQLEVTVGSTDEWACRRLLLMFGGNSRRTKNQNKNWKPFWVWRASSKTAGAFLETIIPYLHLKHDRAILALEFQKARTGKQNHHPLSDTEIALEEAQRILMQSFNRRGTSVEA